MGVNVLFTILLRSLESNLSNEVNYRKCIVGKLNIDQTFFKTFHIIYVAKCFTINILGSKANHWVSQLNQQLTLQKLPMCTLQTIT